MADRMRESAGWLLELVSMELENGLRYVRCINNTGLDEKARAETWPPNIRENARNIRADCRPHKRNLYCQVTRFRGAGRITLSDSETEIKVMYNPEVEERCTKGRGFSEATVGAVLALRHFDLAYIPNRGVNDLHLLIRDFDYYGVCSLFGNPRPIQDIESVVLQVQTVRAEKQNRSLPMHQAGTKERKLIQSPHRPPQGSFSSQTHLSVMDHQSVELSSSRPGTSSRPISRSAQPLSIADIARSSPSESALLERSNKLRGLLQKDQIRKTGQPSKTAEVTDTSVPAPKQTLSGSSFNAEPTGNVHTNLQRANEKSASSAQDLFKDKPPLSELKPDDSYIFKGDFKFAKYIPTILHDDFYHEQMRLLSLSEAQYPPEAGVKFAESNFPVEAVNQMRATVQKRAAYKESQQAQQMQQALQKQASEVETPASSQRVDENDAEFASSAPEYPWSPSPERVAKRELSLPPDSSAPEELPGEDHESVKTDSADDMSDLEMQEPAALELQSHHTLTVPLKRKADRDSEHVGSSVQASAQPDPKRHQPTQSAPDKTLPTSYRTLEECFELFKKAYPQYSGDYQHFWRLSNLAIQHEVYGPQKQTDDFIIRHDTNYVPFCAKRVPQGLACDPYELFYRKVFEGPIHTKGIVTIDALNLVDPSRNKKIPVSWKQNVYRDLSAKPIFFTYSVTNASSAPRPVGSVASMPRPANTGGKREAAKADGDDGGDGDGEEEDDDDDNDATSGLENNQTLKPSTTIPDSTEPPSPRDQNSRGWWQRDSTAFKEFARSYGSLKSVQGVLGEVLPAGNRDNRIFANTATSFDVLSWNLWS